MRLLFSKAKPINENYFSIRLAVKTLWSTLVSTMEKLRMAKSAFEQASDTRADATAAANKTAVGLVYLTEALIDMSADLQELKTLLNKARRDRNESSERIRRGAKSNPPE